MIFPPDDLEPWFPIETDRLMLREARPEDFDDIHAYAVRDDVVRFMIWGPNTAEETRTVLDSWLDEQALWPRTGVNLVIEETATERVVGSIRLTIQDAANRTADMGYTLHSDVWRRGYGTEAGRAVLQAAFGPLGLHRVFAMADTDNVGSWGIMEKLGMRREATLRKNRQVRGDWRDNHVYAILAEEFTRI